MTAVGRTCPDCGSSKIVDDELYSQPQLVCEDCGSVVCEGLLTTTRSEELQGTDVRYSQTTSLEKQPCRNQIKGLQRVRALCCILRLNKEMQESAETYFAQAYEHPNFIRVSLQKKEVLCGCCVLVSCRLRGWPVAMGTISSLLEADPDLMGVVYQDMVKSLNIVAPTAGITDLLGTHCQDYKLSPCHIPEELSEDAKKLTKRAVALVELAADAWIVTGRQPVPIMMASIYLAWQSLRPTQTRLKYSLDRFCQMAKVSKRAVAGKRVTELKEVLCKLGQEIPWLGTEVRPENVMQQVDDILQHQRSLLRRALRSHEEALLSELPPNQEEPLPGVYSNMASLEGAAPSQVSEQQEHTLQEPCAAVCEPDAESAQQPSNTDRKTCTVVEEEKEEGSPQGSQPPAPNWGKRHLFVPPCVRHAKIRRVEKVLEVTGDEEISDSEIDMYIRTPQEVKEYAEARKRLSSSEDEED